MRVAYGCRWRMMNEISSPQRHGEAPYTSDGANVPSAARRPEGTLFAIGVTALQDESPTRSKTLTSAFQISATEVFLPPGECFAITQLGFFQKLASSCE